MEREKQKPNNEFLDRAEGWIEDNLDYMIELGELQDSERAATLSKINFTADLAGNLAEAGYVLEAVSEDFKLKQGVWKTIGQYAAFNTRWYLRPSLWSRRVWSHRRRWIAS